MTGKDFQWLMLLIFLFNIPGHYSQNNLTLNATSHNGMICPEIAEWTCNITSMDTRLDFYLANSSNTSIGEETIPFFERLNIPIVLHDIIMDDNDTWIFRTLIINNKDLHDLGYTLLICATPFFNVSHSLNLDIEVPKVPQLLAISFRMNSIASQVLMEIKTKTEVYDWFPYCQYRRNSHIAISLKFGGSEVIHLTNPLVHNSDCNNSLCTTRTTLSPNMLSSPFTIAMETISELYNSTSFSLTDLLGCVSITQENCMPTMILCSISEHFVTSQQCRIRHRRFNETFTSEMHLPINQHHRFGILNHNTAYVIEVTFQLKNATFILEKQITTEKEVTCFPSSAMSLIVPVSAAVISLVVCATGVLICLYIYKSRYFTRKTGTMDTGRHQGGATASTVLPYQGDPENFDQYESFCGEFAFMNENSSFKSEESLALPTLDVKTTTFDPYYSSCKSIDKKGKEHEVKKDTQSKASRPKFNVQETGNRSYNTLERNAMELEYEEMASAKRAFAKGTAEYAELENRKREQQQLSANLETSHEYDTPTNM